MKTYYNLLIIIYSLLTIILFLIVFIFYYSNIYFKRADSNKTFVKKSMVGGKLSRGVFANIEIKEGEIIEEHYLIIDEDYDSMNCGIYSGYIYKLTDKYGVGFALGNGGLYNHSKDNNAILRTEEDKFKIIATKKINKNEEIFICYGCNHPNVEMHHDYNKFY